MKTETDAIKELLFDSGRATADHAVDLLLQKPALLNGFSMLAFSDQYPFDMRSSNVIEKADEQCAGFAASLIPDIIQRLTKFKNDGPRRQFLRMLTRYVHEMDEDFTGILYDACYGFACDPGQPVAVRHNSVRILGELARRYPDLMTEIKMALTMRLTEETGPFGGWLKEFIQSLR